MIPLWRVERPPSRWDAVRRHGALFLVTGGILLVSFVVRPERIPFRTCVFACATGRPCITCGYIRAFSAMAKGDWPYALHDSPVVVVLYALTAFLFAWNAAALAFGVVMEPGPLLKSRAVKWSAATVLIALVLANWIYRLVRGFS